MVLLVLGSSCQVGELHVLQRQGFCSFGPGGHFFHLQLFLFPPKNELAGFQRGSLVIAV